MKCGRLQNMGRCGFHLADYYLEGCRNIKKQLTVGDNQSKDKPFFMISDGIGNVVDKRRGGKEISGVFW